MEYNVYSADRLGEFTRAVGFFVQKNVYEKEYKNDIDRENMAMV